MKTRETKKQNRSSVILSEEADGINKVRLMGSARAGEEEEKCPWEEIDDYSGRFVVAGYRYDDNNSINNYHPWLAYSTDGGKTWTESVTTANPEQTHGQLQGLAYGGGRFVVAGRRGDDTDSYHPWLAYSADGGKTWTKSVTTAEEGQIHGQLRALAYGGGRFVVAGYRYDEIGTTDRYRPWLAYSTDGGKTWTRSVTTAASEQTHRELRALAYGGGRFVVAGYRYDDDDNSESENYRPWLAYSTDGGKTWTESETTAKEEQTHRQLRALAYGGGRFVVAGFRYDDDDNSENENYHPWLAYSTDGGKTWTESETTAKEEQTHGQLYALAYGDGRFVVAGYRYDDTDRYHPWLAYSTDGGKTWTRSETTAEEQQTHGWLWALTYGGGRFVVSGFRYYGTDNRENENHHPWLAYSTDGGKTWTPSETTAAENQVHQEHGEPRALTYAPDSYCWKFGKEEETEETTE